MLFYFFPGHRYLYFYPIGKIICSIPFLSKKCMCLHCIYHWQYKLSWLHLKLVIKYTPCMSPAMIPWFMLDFSWWYSVVECLPTHFTVENNQHLSFSKDWILQELDNFNASVAIQDQLKTIESYRSISINDIFDSHICHVYDNSTQNYRFNFFLIILENIEFWDVIYEILGKYSKILKM